MPRCGSLFTNASIGASVVRGLSAQQRNSDQAFLQFIDIAMECALNNMAQKLAALGAGTESQAVADCFDDRLQGGDAARIAVTTVRDTSSQVAEARFVLFTPDMLGAFRQALDAQGSGAS